MGTTPDRVKPKTIRLVFVCFSAKHAAIRRENNDWLAQNQANVWEWSGMSIHGLLFQWNSTIKIQLIKRVGHCKNLASLQFEEKKDMDMMRETGKIGAMSLSQLLFDAEGLGVSEVDEFWLALIN